MTISKKIEESLKNGPILPEEILKEEYDKVINYLISIGYFKQFDIIV